ncbi:MAG: hypothetical protein Q4P15_02320 [Propionibacteriaceae bacterium]|nr:hypothetical protein [Propionibacteriaceae bacterium]
MRKLVAAASSVVLALGMVSTLAPAANAATPLYTLKVLSPNKGFAFARPYAINDKGDVVGASENEPVAGMTEERSAATTWPAADYTKPVTVKFASGDSYAVAISEEGTMLGNEGEAGKEPFIHKAGKITRLTSAASLPSVDDGVGISAAGVALTADGSTWTSPAKRQMLPVPKGKYASAGGISPSGVHIVGLADAFTPDFSPVRWTNRKLVKLGTPVGSSMSQPYAVNDRGVAVGYAMVSGRSVPAIWDSKGSPSWLPRYPELGQQYPMANNNDGVVVGYGNYSPEAMAGSDMALLWKDGKVLNLDDVVAKPAGARIDYAADINNRGQIVGTMKLSNGSEVGFIATPSSAPTVDVYTTPGIHHVNGRDWKTACEKYSQTKRCRTEIVATQVNLVNGKYTHVKGWTFNNLTYLPASRSLWKGNPLATPGEHSVAGRKWKTECDNATTGGNGCRSYIFGTRITATPKGGGTYTYTQKNEWVFNNIVMFS